MVPADISLKGVSMDELANAITTVYNGWAMINPDIANQGAEAVFADGPGQITAYLWAIRMWMSLQRQSGRS